MPRRTQQDTHTDKQSQVGHSVVRWLAVEISLLFSVFHRSSSSIRVLIALMSCVAAAAATTYVHSDSNVQEEEDGGDDGDNNGDDKCSATASK